MPGWLDIHARSTTRYTTFEALALHESISPDRWCVTRADLRHLRKEVRRAIQAGEIRPPDDGSHEFQSSDELYGPSIYTVNTQHIMPVTEQAGKVSWALMRHPDGLDCDLFISHAWQEGVFEFLSKVLHSWPAGARHAWCCMLANPQNLDIGALLQSPSSSPFALALQASSCVLVVPNRHCSIYTRLWCSYEAYIAHQSGKVILVATSSTRRKLVFALLQNIALGLLGTLLAYLLRCRRHADDSSQADHSISVVALCLVIISLTASTTLQHQQCRAFLNRIGPLTSGFLMVHWDSVHSFPCMPGLSDHTSVLEQRVRLLMYAGFFYLLEVDRVNGQSKGEAAVQLQRGFQGSIKHAACSKPGDAARIHSEIGAQTEAVDYAIQVLLTAGMSTPTLRIVARAGVGIQDAGHAEIAVPFSVLVFLTFTGAWTLLEGSLHLHHADLPLCLPLLGRVSLMVMIYRSAADARCFIMKMMTKLVAFYFVVLFPFLLSLEWAKKAFSQPDSADLSDQAYASIVLLLAMCTFACL
ncbi:unnamed protein product, partial [Symbiodinium natans]